MELSDSGPLDEDQFLSFAKRSRVVERLCYASQSIPQQPVQLQRKEDFWHDNLYQSSDDTHSESATTLQRVTIKSVRGLQRHKKGKKRPLLFSEKLPSPAELMGRDKRKKPGGGMSSERSQGVQPQEAAVLHHIGDLRRRQGSVDKMKKERWGSKSPRPVAEERSAPGPELDDMSVPQVHQQYPTMDFFSTTRKGRDRATVSRSSSLTPYGSKGLFGEFVPHLAPGGNPIMSFVLATAERQADEWVGAGLSHQEFWGIADNTEE